MKKNEEFFPYILIYGIFLYLCGVKSDFMKKSQRNKKKSSEQKQNMREKRSRERILSQIERKTRREARVLELLRANQNYMHSDIDAKIDAVLIQKILHRNEGGSPSMNVLLGFDSIFGRIKKTSFAELIGDIPTLAAVNYVVGHMDEMMYSPNDPKKLRVQLNEIAAYLTYKEKRKFLDQLIRFYAVILFSNEGCFRFIYYAMQNYRPMPVGDYALTFEDTRRIYKCLTYCNQIVTNEQSKNVKISKETAFEALMAIDVPIVEFKTFKFFQTQLVKALRFFEFCENPMEGNTTKATSMREEYGNSLRQFYKDMGVDDWRQYLKSLMFMILHPIKNKNGGFLTIKDGESDKFIQSLLLNPKEFEGKDYKEAFKYLREHFLWQMSADWNSEGVIPDNAFLLLNSNLLVDRLYQGVIFSFRLSMNKYRKSKGEEELSFKKYKGTLGEVFAEPRLFYPIMQRTFNNDRYDCMPGNTLKEKYKIDGVSDYYIKVADKLLLFEFKDNVLGDEYKYAHDVPKLKNEIIHRLCNPGSSMTDDNRKGVYQLMDTIRDLDSTVKYDKAGIAMKGVTSIYPLLVVTDTAFCANGVNAIITKEYTTKVLPQYAFTHDFTLHTPIIINIDTLMNIAKRVTDGFWNFEDMLDGYLQSIEEDELAPASTFDGFVVDEFIHKVKFDENSATYIFGDDLKPLLGD